MRNCQEVGGMTRRDKRRRNWFCTAGAEHAEGSDDEIVGVGTREKGRLVVEAGVLLKVVFWLEMVVLLEVVVLLKVMLGVMLLLSMMVVIAR